MSRCGCDTACSCILNEGDNVTITGDGSVDHPYVIAAGDDGSDRLPAAVQFSTTSMADSVSGLGTMTVMVLPVDDAVLGIALAGDTFPRWLLAADATGGGLKIGNGSGAPQVYISTSSGAADQFYIFAPNGVRFESSGGSIELDSAGDTQTSGNDLLVNDGHAFIGTIGKGVVLRSPDGSQHRIAVDNAGVLTTVPWP